MSNFLTSCPDDILGLIFNYLNADDLLFLWLTGCSDLQQKMQKHVTNFMFDHNFFTCSFRPSILKFLPNINTVYIHLANYRVPDDSKFDYLDLIPTRVNKLVLNFEQSFQTFVKFWRSSLHSNSNLSNNLIPEQSESIWPQLQSLTLGTNPRYIVGNDLLDLLPSTLTHFDFHANPFKHYDMIGKLPRGLTKLGLGQCMTQIPASAAIDFPPLLTSLSITGEWPCNYTSKLPRSLLELDHSHYGFDLDGCNLDIHDLPRNLTNLSIPNYSYTIDQLQHLPQSITNLKLGKDDQEVALNDAALQYLPQSLKSIDFVMDLNLDSIPLLPKALTSITIKKPSVGNVENLQKLPINLTSLKLEMDFEITPEAVSWLPRTITELLIRTVNDEHCAFLPPRLTQLGFKNGILSQEGVRLLPITLKDLTAPFTSFKDNAAIAKLPFNLQHLTLAYSLSPASKQDCLLTETFSELLPKSLKSLFIWERDFHAFNDRFIQGLQNHQDLETLNLNGISDYITEAAFSNLPANLLHFQIDWLSPNLTKAAISNLPKKLSSFSISSKCRVVDNRKQLQISLCDEDYALFPRTLRSLVLPKTSDEVTTGCAKYLPRNIYYQKR